MEKPDVNACDIHLPYICIGYSCRPGLHILSGPQPTFFYLFVVFSVLFVSLYLL